MGAARQLLDGAGFEPVGSSERVAALGGALNATRVAMVDAVGVWDRESRWAWDGAISAEAWLVNRLGVARGEAAGVVAVARLCARFEQAAAALHGVLDVPDFDVDIDGGDHVLGPLRGHGPVGLSFAQLQIWSRVVTPERGVVFEVQAQRCLAICVRLNLRQTKTVAAKWASGADDLLGLGEPDDHRRRGLWWHCDQDGTLHLKGVLDAHNAAMVLEAFDTMDRPDPDDTPGGPRTTAQRRADDLGELARRFNAGVDLADNERRSPSPTHHVLVFVRPGDNCGETAEGHVVDAGLMDLFSCTAWFSKIIFDEHGDVLDLSRRARLFSASQRKAVIARDRHCQFPGCDRPPSWCDVHHVRHWEHGGTTDLVNGVLICHQHHRLLHAKHWALRRAPDYTWQLDQNPPPDPDRQPHHQHHGVPA